MMRHLQSRDSDTFTACGIGGLYTTEAYNAVTCKRCRRTVAWNTARQFWHEQDQRDARDEEARSLKGATSAELERF